MPRFAFIPLLMAVPVLAQVVSYEANAFPELEGWIHDDIGDGQADRFIEDGWLVQIAEAKPEGEQDRYRRSIAEFSGSKTFFVEWVTYSNGPSEAIEAVAPVNLSAYGTSGILYHFTIADDEVRFIQDVVLPQVWVDIEPGVHTYRVELQGAAEFLWFIDGELVHAGVPEGPYPTSDSSITFRCKGAIVGGETVCYWDAIRYGTIPEPGGGDYTQDGEIGLDDFYYFHLCLTTLVRLLAGLRLADANFDGQVNCADWEFFLAAWTDSAAPPIVAECMCGMADLNGSNSVEADDLALLLGAWGPNPTSPADLSDDDMINASDLALLLGAWGPCE